MPIFKFQPRLKTTLYNLLIGMTLLISGQIKADEKVILQLKWQHQYQFAGYYAAKEKGFYQQAGIDVEIRAYDKQSNIVDAVVKGEVHFGILDTTLVLKKLTGQPVVVLAAFFQHSPHVLISLASSGIISPLEMQGKRIMFQKNSDDAMIAATFAELDLSEQDYTHIPQSYNLDDLIENKVDVIDGYIGNEPFYYTQKGFKVNIISPANYGIDFYGDMLFTSENFLTNNTKLALAFRQASILGWQYALDNPDEVIGWLTNQYHSGKSIESLQYEASTTRKMIAAELIEIGTVNINRFERIAKIYKTLNLAPTNANINGIYYQDFLQTEDKLAPWLYLSWLVLLAVVIIALVLWGLNLRLKTLVKERTLELEESKKVLEKLSVTDPLTGLCNRRRLDEFYDIVTNQATRYHHQLSVILFDIDWFKKVNDNYGHHVGDIILQEIANVAKVCLRKSDLIGRWGGEEFLILCPETDLDGALKLATNLRIAFKDFEFSEVKNLTCSFGITLWDCTDDNESLFERVDKALYQAKENGRNRVESIIKS